MSGARVMPVRSAISPLQRRILEYVRDAEAFAEDIPYAGEAIAAVEGARGGGPSSGYHRIQRLVERGFLRGIRVGSRLDLEITAKGAAKLAAPRRSHGRAR